MSWTSANLFWRWNTADRILWPGLFHCTDTPGLPGNLLRGIGRCGTVIHEEYVAMVRGLVPLERPLEWTVKDGWEPLCEFLGVEQPSEPFPHMNDAAGFEGRVDQAMKLWFKHGVINVGKAVIALFVVIVSVRWMKV